MTNFISENGDIHDGPKLMSHLCGSCEGAVPVQILKNSTTMQTVLSMLLTYRKSSIKPPGGLFNFRPSRRGA